LKAGRKIKKSAAGPKYSGRKKDQKHDFMQCLCGFPALVPKAIIISGRLPDWPQIVAYRMGFLRALAGPVFA
jgi:hypothetical protein